MPISSLIIRTGKNQTQAVVESLKHCPDASSVEVFGENIIVITETSTQDRDKTLWEEIESIPGVLQCDLIYHNFEDEGS